MTLTLNPDGYADPMTYKAAFIALTTGMLPVVLREADAVKLLARARAAGEGYLTAGQWRVRCYESDIRANRFHSIYRLRFTPAD